MSRAKSSRDLHDTMTSQRSRKVFLWPRFKFCFDRFTSFEALFRIPDGVMDGSLSDVGTESAVLLNGTPGNVTLPAMSEGLSHQFIYSVYAQIVSGLFVWAALILTCIQVSLYDKYELCSCHPKRSDLVLETCPKTRNTARFQDNGALYTRGQALVTQTTRKPHSLSPS